MKPSHALPLELFAVIHHEIRDANGRVIVTLSCEFDDAARRISAKQAWAIAELLERDAEEPEQ